MAIFSNPFDGLTAATGNEQGDFGCRRLGHQVSTIMGKWKGVILFYLLEGTMRFNELARQMEGITPRLLTKQLRELEAAG